MSTISGVSGGTSAAWSDVSAARASRQEKLFAKVDADGSGAIDKTELQGLLDKVAEKTGTTAQKADDVLSKLDTDGNGTLDQRELKAGLKSLLPAPTSTHEFVQQHVSPDSDPISQAENTAGTAAASTDLAKPTDSNGGDTAAGPAPTDGPPHGHAHGGGAGTSSATSRSSDATSDPLDTNKDGVVSAQERAAGDLKNVLVDLLKAIDSNGDKKVGASEVDTFQKNVAAALQSLSAATSTTATAATPASTSASTDTSSSDASSSNPSAPNSPTSSDGSTSDVPASAVQRRHTDFSLSAFAHQVLKQYAATAGTTSSPGAALSTTA